MYRQHFGLGEHPFSLTPDTQFFFNSESHCQILSTVLQALRHSEGFIKIVGEVGTGKTLLSRMLLASLGETFKTVYIPNPYLTPEELKWFLAEEIGIAYSPSMPSYQLLKEINERLIALSAQQHQVVLVVDEAQAMPRETIEALRLLTNLETEKNKLLQVVLIGQPELDDILNRPDLRQLKQRIVFAEYLQGISRSKVASYISYRLTSAGYRGAQLFSSAACALLYRASGGVPRLINVIAHKAMLAAYGEKSDKVTRAHIAGAIAETQESRSLGRMLAKRSFWLWPGLVFATSLSLVFATSLSALLVFAVTSYRHISPAVVQSTAAIASLEKNINPSAVTAAALATDVVEKPIADTSTTDNLIEAKSVVANSIVASSMVDSSIVETENPHVAGKAIVDNSALNNTDVNNVQKDDLHLQSRIEDLLQQASRALRMDRLTSPIEDNAFGYYQKILVLNPDDSRAHAGLEAIAARYLAKAQEQLSLGNQLQADSFKQRANVVAPDYYHKYEMANALPTSQVVDSASVGLNSLPIAAPTAKISPVKSEVIKPFVVAEASSINVVTNSGWKDEQMVGRANELVQQNKPDQAIALLKSFIVSEEKPIQSLQRLVDIYLQQVNTQAVEILLRNAEYLSPVEKAKMQAQLLTAQGNTVAAIGTLEQQLSAAENNEQYGALLASLYHKTGQYQQSVVSYQRLLKSYGEKPAYWLGLALAFDGLTQHNNALQAYQHLREFPQLQNQVKVYIEQRIVALRSQ
jgi:MSHA biogenesis protein MshM